MQNDDETLESRLARLKTGLETQKAAEKGVEKIDAGPKADNLGQAMSLGMRVMAEFVSGVAVGVLLGWQFDKWFGTSPWLLIIFLALGTITGFWNVYRIAAKPTSGPINPTNDKNAH